MRTFGELPSRAGSDRDRLLSMALTAPGPDHSPAGPPASGRRDRALPSRTRRLDMETAPRVPALRRVAAGAADVGAFGGGRYIRHCVVQIWAPRHSARNGGAAGWLAVRGPVRNGAWLMVSTEMVRRTYWLWHYDPQKSVIGIIALPHSE